MDSQLKAIHDGDIAALNEFLKECEKRIYFTALRLVNNEQDALDITQEALIRVYRHINTFTGETAKVTTWITSIVKNLCIDFFRRQKNTDPIDEGMSVPSKENVEKHLESVEFSDELKGALNNLPSNHRDAFVLRHYEEKSYDEIAQILSVPLNTVRSHLHRATKQLRNMLTDYSVAS